ncbi:MAG: YciI family protein [Rhodanobacter sp.]
MNRYLVFLKRRPALDPAVVPQHLAYLDGLRTHGQVELSGGFTDKSGGAYLLRAASLEAAQSLLERDPAYISGGWEITLHEWLAH